MAREANTVRGGVPKRIYWIKLFASYLSEPRMRMLGTLGAAKADSYKLMWLEVLLLCVRDSPHQGEIGCLRVSEEIPYDWPTMASMLNRDVDEVRGAFEAFSKLKMVTVLSDGTIYVEEIQRLIGRESDAAPRMRKMREKKKAIGTKDEGAGSPGSVTLLQHDVTMPPHLEKEEEIDSPLTRGDESISRELELIVDQLKKQRQEGLGRLETP